MSKSDDIITESIARLGNVSNSRFEEGFYSQYQNEDLDSERLIVLQIRTDGPCIHKSSGNKMSSLDVLVFGAVEFSENASVSLRAFLKEIREALFPKTERTNFNGLVVSVVETQATPFHEPKDGQKNGYFILPLTFKYTENQS